MAGVVFLVAALVVAGALAVAFQARNGRVKAGPGPGPAELAIAELVPAGDARVTLLQFSTSFCAPCRVTRRVLGGIAEVVPGVQHLEIDAESHLDAVRALEIHRTPTTLILDADRRVVARASGAPRRDEVMSTLARIIDGVPEPSQPVA